MIDSDGPKRFNPLIKLVIVGLAVWIVISGTIHVADAILPRMLIRDIDGELGYLMTMALTLEGLFTAGFVIMALGWDKD